MLFFFLIDAMAKLTRACCTNPLSLGLHFVTPCEIKFLLKGNSRTVLEIKQEFLNCSIRLVLELFKNIN